MFLFIACAFAAVAPAGAQTDGHRGDWGYFLEEASLQRLHSEVSSAHRPREWIITDVHVVDVDAGTVAGPTSIHLVDGRVRSIGSAEIEGVRRLDGRGRYAVAGLCDMHVHRLSSTAQPMLDLLHGITCVRDMGGFGWMLRVRRAGSEQSLAPRAWIAGPILTNFPMGWYSEVVDDDAAIRDAVARHRSAGYDFIKLHNSMSPGQVRVVFEAAERAGMAVVGHTPHRTPLAFMAAKARTIEHLTGILVEPDLQPTGEDWEAIVSKAQAWFTPTLYASQARALQPMAPDALVPAAERRRWALRASEGSPHPIHTRAASHALAIARRLIELDVRLLAGTDTGGGSPFHVYGAGLHDEMQRFRELGMTSQQALRSATTNAARALGAEGMVGRIAPGAHADLILVESNPLMDATTLRAPTAVCIAAACLDEQALAQLRSSLSAVFATAMKRGDRTASAAELEDWLTTTRSLHGRGYVFRDNYLEAAGHALEDRGLPELAAEILGMKTDPAFSFGAGN